MTLAVGVDIIEVARIEQSLGRLGTRFLDRIFTAQEQAYCEGRASSLAGRFAVKEAVAKALGTGIGEVGWRDIEVVNDERGRPQLVLHGEANRLAESFGLSEWSISLSHSDKQAIGMAVALGKQSNYD
jgi:holo-[acyl-carrier protein] synthase